MALTEKRARNMRVEFTLLRNILRIKLTAQATNWPENVVASFVATSVTTFMAIFFLTGCAAVSTGKWESTLDTTHELVGKIWSSREQRWVSERELNEVLAEKQYILLGETHDNPDHHRLQLKLLKAVSGPSRHPLVAMEQFDIENQALIDAAMKTPAPNADAVADAGKLNRKGWQWEQYRPIVEFVISQQLSLRAANLSRTDTRRIFADGLKASPTKFDDNFFARTWNEARAAALKRELIDGHCGQLPDAMTPGMANVQRARDAAMASSMLTEAVGQGAIAAGADANANANANVAKSVLIAGRGHVRRDRAVPLYLQSILKQTASKSEIAVVAFMEVETGKFSPQDYIDVIANESAPFDYVWFTPRTARKDPCEGLSFTALQATPAQSSFGTITALYKMQKMRCVGSVCLG